MPESDVDDDGLRRDVLSFGRGRSRMQVIDNVLRSTIEVSEENGSIDICDRFLVGSSCGLGITVAASGRGRERVFEPFSSGKDKETGEGTGMGLSISRTLTESMKGNLHSASVSGRRAAFRIEFPMPNG